MGVYAKGEIIRSFFKDWFVKGSFPVEAAESIEMRVGESKFKPRGYALELVARIDHQIKIRLDLVTSNFRKNPSIRRTSFGFLQLSRLVNAPPNS